MEQQPGSTINLLPNTNVIERHSVVKGTRDNYTSKLTDFICWLWENGRHDVLSNQCANKLLTAQRNDNRSTQNLGYQRNINRVIRRCISKVKRKDSESSPIRLVPTTADNGETNDRVLTYDDISDFMMTKHKIVKVDKILALEFKDALARSDENEDEDGVLNTDGVQQRDLILNEDEVDEDGQVNVMIRLEASTYEGIRSVVAFLYRESGVLMPENMNSSLALYIKGSRCMNRLAKQTLGLKIVEGKKHMTLSVYKAIASILFESCELEHIFAHLFFILDWNLMKRAENCVNAKISHIKFSNDCLVFEFAKSKGHQDGKDHCGPWHLYANPYEPQICPVLALARYMFMFPDVLSGYRALFEGKDQYNRYTKIFSRIVSKNMATLESLGVKEGDLGTHSSRKGVATMVASGCTASPSIVSICLRAGWVMGGVKDRYLKYERAGDQYVGRCASCLDQTSKNFAVSPPYFDYSDIKDLAERNEMKQKLNTWIDQRLCHRNINGQTRHLIQLCFASICYHKEFLDSHLHANSPFRSSEFMKDIPDEIVNLATVKFPWNSSADTPMFTGIPPHIIILAELEHVKSELAEMAEKLANKVNDIFEERGIRSAEFHTRAIIDKITELSHKLDSNPGQQMHNDRSGGKSNEHHPVLFEPYVLQDEIIDDDYDDDNNLQNLLADEQREIRKRKIDASQSMVRKRMFTVGAVRGKLTSLPPDFKFPTMTCSQLISNWYIGNKNSNIVPYCRLSPSDLHHVKHGIQTRQKMARFMNVIEKYGRSRNCWVERESDWTVDSVSKLWMKIGQKDIFGNFADSDTSKTFTGSWRTMLDKMIKRGAFKKTRDECDNDEMWRLSIYNNHSNIDLN